MTDQRDPARPPAEPSADFEARTVEWLERQGRPEAGELAAVRASIATLPARRARRPVGSWIAAAAAAVIVVAGGIAVAGSRFAPGSGGSASVSPGVADPGLVRWATDPRYAACTDRHVDEPALAFEMTHAQWFPLHFPGWSRGAEELEVDDPALVVIGKEQSVPRIGGPPAAGQSFAPDANLGYQMCIAVGPPSGFVVHDYSWTHFDRVVPVLSPDDVARAAHLDPDVLADPAAWRFPERLAPCGGRTGNELYIFEISDLLDFRRSFPRAPEVTAFDTSEPGIVIVYRDPLPLVRRAVNAPTGEPGIRDICVVFEGPAGDGRAALLPDVDITGFHVRLDAPVPAPSEPAPASPTPSTAGVTPTPGPAWAGDATAALTCGGAPWRLDPVDAPGTDAGTAVSPAEAVRTYLERLRVGKDPVPVEGFVERDATPAAALFVNGDGGPVSAAIVVSARPVGADTVWVVASVAACPEAELDPAIPTGRSPFGIWADATGEPVSDGTLTATADCYHGTQVRFEGRLYVRIPGGGVDPAQLELTWSRTAALPDVAHDTGLASGSRRLFARADGKAIYVVDGDQVERLPHVIGDEVLRTDCN